MTCDVVQLVIANSQHLTIKTFTALVSVHGRVVRTKVHILALIGWLATSRRTTCLLWLVCRGLYLITDRNWEGWA